MSPNMKAIERLEEVEGRLDETEKEFEKARKEAKQAKDKFNAVKERRYFYQISFYLTQSNISNTNVF